MIELWGLAAIGVSFLLALLGSQVAKRRAAAWGFVDEPGRNRHHSQPTPLLGGSAILVAVLVPASLALALAAIWSRQGFPGWASAVIDNARAGLPHSQRTIILMAGAVLLHGLGLIDDKRGLPWWLKLAGQLVCITSVVLLTDIRLLEMLGEPASTILSVGWMVLIVNAFNLLDHMDGLAAGVAAICSAALLAAAAAAGQMLIAGWLCLLLGASLGFLVHNFPPAKLFMGDAGSMVLGYALAAGSILTTYRTGGPEAPYYAVFLPIVLLAVPLYDTFSVLTLRLKERRNPMVGDTRHFCHRLLRRGMSPRKAVLTIYLATAATAVGASLLPHVRDAAGAVLVFSQAAGIVLLIAVLESADARVAP